MNDGQIFTQEVIPDNPLPGQTGVVTIEATSSSPDKSGMATQSKIQEQWVPTKKIATELLSDNLNTRSKKILAEFQFTPSGAIQIGDYRQGDAGDIRISPDGIVARDKYGNTTFALDGVDGSAVFSGRIQTGTLIAGIVAVGDDAIQIDGETKRMLFYDANNIPSIVIGTVS